MAAPAPRRRSTAPPPPAPRNAFSRPVLRETFVIQSDAGQKVLRRERGFVRVMSALYSINVILYIIGDAEAADQVEAEINAKLTDFATRLAAERQRLATLSAQHGANRQVAYTNPKTLTVSVTSPQLARYVELVRALDALMIDVDSLWMLMVLTNRQKATATAQWRNELLRIGRFIMNLEVRARRSAERQGRTAEVAAADAHAPAVEDEEGPMTVDDDAARPPVSAGDATGDAAAETPDSAPAAPPSRKGLSFFG